MSGLKSKVQNTNFSECETICLLWKSKEVLFRNKLCNTYYNSAALVQIIYFLICRKIWLHTRYESKKKTGILLYSWLPPNASYHNNLAIWYIYFFFFRNMANLGHFFLWKIPCIGRNHIFQVKIWRKVPPPPKHGYLVTRLKKVS
jgi:hypothetical protein